MLNLYELIAQNVRRQPIVEGFKTDPASWAVEKLGAFVWSKQREIFDSVAVNRRTLVQSSHGPGKSWTAGALAGWWIDTHPPGEAIVVTTAPTYKQVHGILWEEIRKQHIKGQLPGKVLMTDQWYIGTSLVGEGRKPADHDTDGFQGTHRRYVLVILDECCGVPPVLWTGAESITTNEHCRIVAIGNPDNPASEMFTAAQPGSEWNVIKISTFDTPNFTGEEVPSGLRELLPDKGWAASRLKKWGPDSPLYQSKVLGEFPATSVDTLIPMAWIQRAQLKELPEGGWPRKLGVDVARFGTDRSVIYERQGGRIRLISDRNGEATTMTAGRVVLAWRETQAEDIQVDGVGVGGGVVDILDEDGYPVQDMQAGGAPADPTRFLNARAEWYWQLRTLFERDEVDLDPEDDELASQLASLKYEFNRRGRIKIESKDDMRKRGMPSPDRADACMLTVAEPVDPNATSSVQSA